MTISDANWNSGTDPFRAVDVSVGAPTWDAAPENFAATLAGLLNAIHDDADVQRVYLRETASPWREIKLDAFQRISTGYNEQNSEFSADARGRSGNTYYVHDFPVGYTDGAGGLCWGRYRNTSQAGADTFGLAAECAYWWATNPAKIIMAMLHHYLPSTFGGTGLRDFMSKEAFQAASADFEDYAPTATDSYSMVVWREVGVTIKAQVEKILRQTVDWMCVRPEAVDGTATLHYIRRDAPNFITTAINFDDPLEGISSWTGRVDDGLRVDQIDYEYGRCITAQAIPAFITTWDDDVDVYVPQFNGTPDLLHEEYTFSHIRRYEKKPISIDLPYVQHRWEIERHWHIYQWAWEQHDIVFTHGPRNFNYEVGDVVPIICAELGLDGTQKFLIYEKHTNYATLHSVVRAMRVYGYEGTRPDRLDRTVDMKWWHRCETLAGQPDGALAHRFTASFLRKNQRFEKWLTSHSDQFSTSNTDLPPASSGSGEVLRSDDAESLNGWPTLDVSPSSGLGADGFSHDLWTNSTVGDVGWYVFVCKHLVGLDAAYPNDEVLVRSSNGAGNDSIIWLFHATGNASQVETNGVRSGTGILLPDTDWHVIAVRTGDGVSTTAYMMLDAVAIDSFASSPFVVGTDCFLLSLSGNGLYAPELLVVECFHHADNTFPLSTGAVADVVPHFIEKYRFDQ